MFSLIIFIMFIVSTILMLSSYHQSRFCIVSLLYVNEKFYQFRCCLNPNLQFLSPLQYPPKWIIFKKASYMAIKKKKKSFFCSSSTLLQSEKYKKSEFSLFLIFKFLVPFPTVFSPWPYIQPTGLELLLEHAGTFLQMHFLLPEMFFSCTQRNGTF